MDASWFTISDVYDLIILKRLQRVEKRMTTTVLDRLLLGTHSKPKCLFISLPYPRICIFTLQLLGFAWM